MHLVFRAIAGTGLWSLFSSLQLSIFPQNNRSIDGPLRVRFIQRQCVKPYRFYRLDCEVVWYCVLVHRLAKLMVLTKLMVRLPLCNVAVVPPPLLLHSCSGGVVGGFIQRSIVLTKCFKLTALVGKGSFPEILFWNSNMMGISDNSK